MTSNYPTDPHAAATPDLDAFLDLLCADEELVRAEFEAIIAAAWPRPPSRRAVVHAQHGGSGGPAPTKGCRRRIESAADHDFGVDLSARQRSPPRHALLRTEPPTAVARPDSRPGPRQASPRW